MDAWLPLILFGFFLLGLGALGSELLPDLVGMELARLLLVRLVNVIETGRAADA